MVQIMPNGIQNSSSAVKRAERGSVDTPPALPVPPTSVSTSVNVSMSDPHPSFKLPLSISSEELCYELDQNGYEIPSIDSNELSHSAVVAPYLDDSFQGQDPIILHPDMQDDDEEEEEEEMDYELNRAVHSIQHEANNNFESLEDDSNKDNWGIVDDPWAATESVVPIPESPNSDTILDLNQTNQTPHKLYIRDRSVSNDSKSSNKSSFSGSSSSKKRNRALEKGLTPTSLYCYRCDIPFLDYTSWRSHAVYEHIMCKNPYPIVEMNYINPEILHLGVTLPNCSVMLDTENVFVSTEEEYLSQPEEKFEEEIIPDAQIKKSRNSSSVFDKDELKMSEKNDKMPVQSTSVTATSEDGESPKEQLKLRFCMNKKGTYVVRQSSVDSAASTSTLSDKLNVPITSKQNNNSAKSSVSATVIAKTSVIIDKTKESATTNSKDKLARGSSGSGSILEQRLKLSTPSPNNSRNKLMLSSSLNTNKISNIVDVKSVKDDTNLPPSVIMNTNAVKEEARKDKEIQKDVAKCVGDVVQRTLSIESELASLKGYEDDSEFEKALELALERSRKGSPSLQVQKEKPEPVKSLPPPSRPVTRRVAKELNAANKPTIGSGEGTGCVSQGEIIRHANMISQETIIIPDSNLVSKVSESYNMNKMPKDKSKDDLNGRTQDKEKTGEREGEKKVGSESGEPPPPLISPPKLTETEDQSNSNGSDSLRIDDTDQNKESTEGSRKISLKKGDNPDKTPNEKVQEVTSLDKLDKEKINVDKSGDKKNEAQGAKQIDKDKEERQNNESSQNSKDDQQANPIENDKDQINGGTSEDVDDFSCNICKKVFLSDIEVSNHFREEHLHIRLSGILEPESPYPVTLAEDAGRSIFADEDQELEQNRRNNFELLEQAKQQQRRASQDINTNNPKYAEALAGILLRNHSLASGPRQPVQSQFHHFTIRGSVPQPQQQQQQQQQRSGTSGYQTITRPLSSQVPGPNRFQHTQMASTGMRPPISSAPGIMAGAGGMPRQMSRPPLQQSMMSQRASMPPQLTHRPQQQQGQTQENSQNYATSLRHALTNSGYSPVIAMHQQMRPTGQVGPGREGSRPGPRPITGPNFPQHHMAQQQQNQHNQHRAVLGSIADHQGPRITGVTSLRDPIRPIGNLAQTISHQQNLINETQKEREAMQAMQRVHQQQTSGTASMPRLQQYPQNQQQFRDNNERIQIINRTLGQGANKRSAGMEMVEISEIRPNKQPKLDNQPIRNLSPAEITISHRLISSNNTAASNNINERGNGNNNNNNNEPTNSVRIGNSITLSVCPSDNPSRGNPGQQQLGNNDASSSSGVSLSPNQVTSVLAVRGVTVTPASPASPLIQAISPASSHPSPNGSPSLQNSSSYSSVIQRGPGNQSPSRNYSPPVITTLRGPLGNGQTSHNFVIPRAPVSMSRNSVQQSQQQMQSSFSVNKSADRPDRPPTVDLTDDEVHAHHVNQQIAMRIQESQKNLHQSLMDQQGRRFPGVGPGINVNMRGPRPVSCNICGLVAPSIQAIEEHKLTSHGQQRMISGPRGAPGPSSVRGPLSGIQIREVRSMHPNHLPPPVRAPPPPPGLSAQSSMRSPLIQQVRSTRSPSRPVQQQQQQSQVGPNPPEKFLYIPLLDMSRMDHAKMQRLEEIGISCVVPLQGGNNLMSQMGIPVMNLRSETNMQNQHIPWDSVLPIGPMHQSSLNNNNNNNIGIGRDGYQQQQQMPNRQSQQMQHHQSLGGSNGSVTSRMNNRPANMQ